MSKYKAPRWQTRWLSNDRTLPRVTAPDNQKSELFLFWINLEFFLALFYFQLSVDYPRWKSAHKFFHTFKEGYNHCFLLWRNWPCFILSHIKLISLTSPPSPRLPPDWDFMWSEGSSHMPPPTVLTRHLHTQISLGSVLFPLNSDQLYCGRNDRSVFSLTEQKHNLAF